MSTNNRSDRLARYFAAVVHGKQEVGDLNGFKKLIEAILEAKDSCVAIERLVSSQSALDALRNADAQTILSDGYLLSSSSVSLRNLGHKIKYLLDMKSSASTLLASETTAGGRHDYDFADFRLTAIFPTTDEMGCTEKPFYRRVDEIAQLSGSQRIAAHADNQFRLLREDMLSALRDDIQVATGAKKGRRSALRLGGLSLARISCISADLRNTRPCTIGVTAKSGLGKLKDLPKEKAKEYLKSTPQFVKHRAFGCFVRNKEVVAFATIDRNIDDLPSKPPVIMLRVFLVVDTATFAYEPILKCLQERVEYPLTEELFLYERDDPVNKSALAPLDVINELHENYRPNIQTILKSSKPVRLDPSQRESLLAGLTQRVSLIQGPPGTGKSFIGAILAKILHDHTKDKILVMCYTNHALDQFLEDLLDIGIESAGIVRLGSKSTPRTQPLSLKEQSATRSRPQSNWNTINALRPQCQEQRDAIDNLFAAYQKSADSSAILDYPEFEDPDYFEAFAIPDNEDGMNLSHGIWALDKKFQDDKLQSWKRALLSEQAASLAVHMDLLDKCEEKLSATLKERTREILKGKKIIGCTTTAAAMHAEDLKHASPGIVLLEEAGEILESHVLTAISSDTKHLILIGDHLQLRPKINSYALGTEKGDGYDLNVSLFERLVHGGYPHTTLQKQHRMCPEISSLVRTLTYPQLEDDEKTKTRPEPRGLSDRVIFFDHRNFEEQFSEAEIVLRIVKYLGQQGYGTDKLVVLTPYLGQLSLLRQTLSKQNDPVLNDLDSHELLQAGLLSHASAKHNKQPIKLSTVDNYQGEESEIVIASLTRSNKSGDIGFMAAPERLNVLLSRARNVLIMVGNSETFVSSRKGQKCWRPLVDQLKSNGHLYDGLPVKCEQHPDKTAVLRSKEDFDRETPDGGCSAPCGVKLNCGAHEWGCTQQCCRRDHHSHTGHIAQSVEVGREETEHVEEADIVAAAEVVAAEEETEEEAVAVAVVGEDGLVARVVVDVMVVVYSTTVVSVDS
ncbi:P-loop containing nucleoside triphosphate hydrolase protein [Penicillium verhagenii]|nr:P-loop containing nucleoside triphosphate hydrolase protein [Penicillium verhagenii]